ncbi:CAP domain-containing protein [Streptomyces mangrovisoli]|uniref:SCP domain-containing protein n=1 Tax=Streptomyces mangrovisoli TaxID=1428628 RepID=A0A1J4NUG3_9ACTN|nr:CAP domain-containing protein [Streptomyces mangrovisoli]OIJ65944.1 hypothetical protein WN71_020895 [Streptomyces mangrovisoli]
MGRHRRSDAGSAATGRAMGAGDEYGTGSHDPHDFTYDDRPVLGIAPYLNPDAHQAYDRSQEYLYATDDDYARDTGTMMFPEDAFTPDDGPRRGGKRRKKKAVTPVKSGLLGVSAAVALGTVAVATGQVPGLHNYKIGGGVGPGEKVQAQGAPSNTTTEQGGTSGSADDGRDDGSATSRDAGRDASPEPSSPTPSASASKSAEPSKTPSKEPESTPTTTKPKATASASTKTPPKQTAAPVTVSEEAAAEAAVLKLVNEERAKVGCSALSANSSLTELAENFSKQMADEDFFDHTDPSGATPWDRAAKLGITNLGGENIARGQADAAAVMDAWMNSEGHRANILNCDFKTLGVGVHFGSGGPWWTQDFGY